MRKLKSLITKYLSPVRNEKGIALAMVLIISLIALTTMAGLIYMVTSGTQISGMQKRYKTALEVGKGGNDIAHQVINLKAYESDISSLMTSLSGTISTPAACVVANTTDTLPDGTTCVDHIADCSTKTYPGLCVKLNLPTVCWSSCDSSITIDPTSSSSYDMSFNLGNYTAHAKIVDTVYGNSSPSDEILGDGKGTVETGSELSAIPIPFLYTIEVESENIANPAERANISVLYQF